MFANLYATSEASGQQDTTLLRLYHFYEDEGFRKMRTFILVFNGLLYLAIVLLVGYFVISFYVSRYKEMMNQF
jgi:type II secretory pathway component PulF